MTIEGTFSRLSTAFSRIHAMELTKDKKIFREKTLHRQCEDWIWSSIGILLGYDHWAPYKTEQGWATRITHCTVERKPALECCSLYKAYIPYTKRCCWSHGNFIWRAWYILLEQGPIHVQQQVFPLRRLEKFYFMFGLYFWTIRRSKHWEPCGWQKLLTKFCVQLEGSAKDYRQAVTKP